jgi:hypothetical protein
MFLHDDGTVSTSAFQSRDMSLDLCRLRTLPDSIAARPDGWGMSEFVVGFVRGLKPPLDVVHKPLVADPIDGDNVAHCEMPGKATNSQAKRIRDASRLVHPETPTP